MMQVTFDEYEIETLRFLAKRFHQGGNRVGYTEFPRYAEVGQEKVYQTIARLERYCFLAWDSSDTLTIDSAVAEAVHTIDNPPARDYWKDCEVWFRGRWWSVPLVAAVVLLPILSQWIQWVWQLVQWLNVLGN